MNKNEFDEVFDTFCGGYGKDPEKESFMLKAHWLKFSYLEAREYLDIVCNAMDNHKYLPTIGTLMEIRKNIPNPEERPTQQRNPKYMYNPDGGRMTRRDHFVAANKDIEGKKKYHIEHMDLVALYDKMWGNKNQKRPEVIKGSGIKKLSECL